jgi:hypothetical protein
MPVVSTSISNRWGNKIEKEDWVLAVGNREIGCFGGMCVWEVVGTERVMGWCG